jgi:ferritin
MLSQKLQEALNDQINAELASAYLYLAMAAHFEAANLAGSGKWMRRQAREEVEHGMKIFDFVNDRDGRVTLAAIAQPPSQFGSAAEVWEQVLKHEQLVTEKIHRLYALAQKENDYAAQTMLHWFITEQVEEEKSAKAILEQARMIGPSSSAIYFLDRHLGKEAEAKA